MRSKDVSSLGFTDKHGVLVPLGTSNKTGMINVVYCMWEGTILNLIRISGCELLA